MEIYNKVIPTKFIPNEIKISNINITLMTYTNNKNQLYYKIHMRLPKLNINDEIMNTIRWMIKGKKIHIHKIRYLHGNKLNVIENDKRIKIYNSHLRFKSKINDLENADNNLSKYTKQILEILYNNNLINNDTIFTFRYYFHKTTYNGTFVYSDLLK